MPFRFGTDKAGGGLAMTRYIEKPSETRVYVPDGTAVIGSGAFRGCANVSSVTLPGSVRRVMSHAFADCTSLTEIDLGGAEELGLGSFSGCRSLRKVYLPDSVRFICGEVFHGCTALKELRLPAVRPAEMKGLADCRSLLALVVGEKRFTVGGAIMTSGVDVPRFVYNCLEKPGYLLRRFYGFDIDEDFVFRFAFELFGYGNADAAAFIGSRFDEMLRSGVKTGHIGIVKLLLEMRNGEGVTENLIDMAAHLGNHEIYLMLIARRHGAVPHDAERFLL